MASRNFGGTIEAALKDLLNERAIVDDAIQKLQSLIAGTRPGLGEGPKKRGRPAGSTRKVAAKALKALSKPTPTPTGEAGEETGKRRAWSPSARRKAAERMRAYWAEQRKQKSAGGAAKRSRRA